MENGRKKCGAEIAGDSYPNGVDDVSIVVAANETETDVGPTSVRPALQSPMHEHCFALSSPL